MRQDKRRKLGFDIGNFRAADFCESNPQKARQGRHRMNAGATAVSGLAAIRSGVAGLRRHRSRRCRSALMGERAHFCCSLMARRRCCDTTISALRDRLRLGVIVHARRSSGHGKR